MKYKLKSIRVGKGIKQNELAKVLNITPQYLGMIENGKAEPRRSMMISISKILNVSGQYITFWYQRHEDNKIVIEKISVFEFITRIIIHIPEKNQKYIRYYGCYNESTKIVTIKIKEMFRKCNEKSIEFKRAINKWRLNIQITFNIDPLKCPNCDTIMIYTESVW